MHLPVVKISFHIHREAGRSFSQQPPTQDQTQGCPFFDFRDVSPAVCGPALALLSKSQHRTAVSWQQGNSAWPPPFSCSPPHAGLTTTHDEGPAGLISQIRLRVTWLHCWDQHLTQSDCKAQPTLAARSPPFPFIPLHTVPSSLLPFLTLPPLAWADACCG